MGYGSVNLGYTPKTNAPDGILQLDAEGKIPEGLLPNEYIPTREKGAADGVAELDKSGKVPMEQLHAGQANGVAELDQNLKVPVSQIPGLNANKIVSGILPVSRGGTGKSSFTGNRLLYGAMLQLATPSSDSVLMQKGTAAPYWTTIAGLAEKLGQNSIARVQTGSYVGTGTYGKNNPCSLTFDFVPQFVLLVAVDISGGGISFQSPCSEFYSRLTTTWKRGCGFYHSHSGSTWGMYSYGRRSSDGLTWYWYNAGNNTGVDYSVPQANNVNYTYCWIAIG